MKKTLIALSMLLSSTALAAGPGPIEDVTIPLTISGSAFTTQALDATKTFDAIKISGFRFVNFFVDFTRNTATDVTMTCDAARTSDGTFHTMQAISIAGTGVANSVDIVWTKNVTADDKWSWRVNLQAYQWLKCTFDATTGSGTDTITVNAIGSVD